MGARRRQGFLRTDFKHSMGDVVVVVVAAASFRQRAGCWGTTADAAVGAARHPCGADHRQRDDRHSLLGVDADQLHERHPALA